MRVQDTAEDNVKIVEVDTGAGGPEAHGTPRTSRRSSCYATPLCRTPSKNDLYQKISPTPSALTDASARTYSGRYDDFSFATARASPYRYAPSRQQQHDDKPAAEYALLVPSYMANTESSRAKARSQSAPRQRLSSAPETAPAATAVLSPSCCDRPPSQGGGSARRRASLDPLDLPGGAPSRRMERCASRARATTMSSVPGSECGSSSTVGHRGSAHGPWLG